MKKVLLVIVICLLGIFTQAYAQTAAVSPVRAFGINSSTDAVTQMAYLELIKLNRYQVLDYFDMQEVGTNLEYDSCFGQKCLVNYGRDLEVDFLISGSVDGLGNKIIINLKLVDVKNGVISKTKSAEFDNQHGEIQRMIGIVMQEMHDIAPDPELKKSLTFQNEVITSDNIGQVKNSGPRMGIAYAVGSVNEFMQRDEDQGGLGMAPITTLIGYQVEKQYVGTENFSALGELIVNVSGLEQGKFVPSLSLLNGFRFGKRNWEFAFGPTFSFSKKSYGFFDTDNRLGKGNQYYRTNDVDLGKYPDRQLQDWGYAENMHLDSRGATYFSTRWLMAFGRTFQSGALNIPMNIYYSATKDGGFIGTSIGFNIMKKTKKIN